MVKDLTSTKECDSGVPIHSSSDDDTKETAYAETLKEHLLSSGLSHGGSLKGKLSSRQYP